MSITKKGQLVQTQLNEYIIEPDGAIFKKIYYHNNPSVYSFSSTDSFTEGIYTENTYFDFKICNELSTWELILMQQRMSSNEVGINNIIRKWRIIQPANPLTATFDQTKLSNCTRITNGYSDSWTGNYAGLYLINSSNTYLAQNNGSSGNWQGATGCKVKYTSGGITGLPGYNAYMVGDGFQAAYIRVDSIINYANIDKLNIATATELYEY